MKVRSLIWLCLVMFSSCRPFHANAAADAPFLRSVVNIDTTAGTVTLPMYRGRIRDTLVWYVVTESSMRDDARRRGVTWAPKLGKLAGTAAAQYGHVTDGMLEYSAGVDFSPMRVLSPAPDSGFPPRVARAGSVARTGYSPFVVLRDGVVINAPIIASEQGVLDRVVSMDVVNRRAVLRMSRGYAVDRHAWYISTEASDEMVAAMERATYTPSLAAAIGTPALSGILAIVNGETDRASPDRQGLRSALLSDLAPLNVLQHAPDPTGQNPEYSPLWNLYVATWSASAISTNQREKIFTFAEASAFVRRGLLRSNGTGAPNPEFGALQAAGPLINCPLLITFGRQAP